MRYIDLHTHSVYSDGTYTPGELVSYAQKKDLSAISLTDHDTIDGLDERIAGEYKLYRAPMWQMGFTKTLENGETLLAIGAEADENISTNLQAYTIPANKWAVFTVKGSLSSKEHPMDAMWTRITIEWLPTCGYKRAADYEIEVYPQGDLNSEDYTCEIWIPIIKL